MNNPFEYWPDRECDEAFGELYKKIDEQKARLSETGPTAKESGICPVESEALVDKPESTTSEQADISFIRELEAGKMLGVLFAADSDGCRHTLYAFSGQLGHSGFDYPGFVGPVFDYLQPNGYFKTNEADISRQNIEIARYETETLPKIKAEYEQAKRPLDSEIDKLRKKYRESKAQRDAKRKSGDLSKEEEESLIRQSQFEKAELHRLKKNVAERLEPFTQRLNDAEAKLEAMKAKRRADSEALQHWLFSNFRFLNARGKSKSLEEIFADTAFGVPPSGAGECCGPKLLQEAYCRGWKPLAMAEYWYGRPKDGEVRIHGNHYPACRGKCLPILSWMLQGLEVEPPLAKDLSDETIYEPKILFENRWFCVVDKPAGMLSVPGKGASISLEEWLMKHYGEDSDVKLAHRLDQDTSGLVIGAFGELNLKVVRRMFASRRVKKTYVAELDGDYQELGIPERGRISLPLSPDYLDRPRQRIDYERGKEAVTDYEIIGVHECRSRIIFHPITGRTHQLRVHAASPDGLALPIVGDRLYGRKGESTPNRLHLHAQKLEFTFPIDKHPYSFESPLPF